MGKLVTGVSTDLEFLGALRSKGAEITANATPQSLEEAIDGTGGNVSFLSPNEVVVEAVNYEIPSTGLTIGFDISDSVDLFGKVASDLSEGLTLDGHNVKGKLLYISDYTGFSSKPEEQSGNYLALKVNTELTDDIYVELVNGISGPVKLDEDRIIVLRIADKDTQSIKVTCGDLIVAYNINEITVESGE